MQNVKKKIISCGQAVKRMFELLEGETNSSFQKELDEHLSYCRECCNRLEFEQLLKEKLQTISSQKKAPKAVQKRVDNLLKSF